MLDCAIPEMQTPVKINCAHSCFQRPSLLYSNKRSKLLSLGRLPPKCYLLTFANSLIGTLYPGIIRTVSFLMSNCMNFPQTLYFAKNVHMPTLNPRNYVDKCTNFSRGFKRFLSWSSFLQLSMPKVPPCIYAHNCSSAAFSA